MAHTSCMSEAQKYQGHLYRPEKEKKGKQNQNQQNNANKQNQQQGYNHNQKAVQPYVSEEVENQIAVVETMPEAPTPPSAVPDFVADAKPNVFDFYAGQATPNASTADLTKFASPATAVVKFDAETPAPKKSKKKEEKAPKSDKKRKRLHVDTSASSSVDRDLEMADANDSAVPGLHTGLTGGLKQLMERDVFPMTPTDSGDAETPIKRKKSEKREKKDKKEVGLMARMGSSLINSSVGRRTSSGSSGKHEEDKPRKKTKAIEAAPAVASTEVVAYADGVGALEPAAMAEQLMALVPVEEEKSMSMDKALKRYHRMRAEAGGAGKAVEEKELWKALRMKRNDRGEIVLFFAEASA